MTLTPNETELLARARADLRMGVPVDVGGLGLVMAAETGSDARLSALQGLGDAALAITDWRAQTLKARAYDGDVARIALPDSTTMRWVQAVADPGDDLAHPMKGPLQSLRDGDATLARAAVALCKSARLLPAAVIVPGARADGVTVVQAQTVLAQHMLDLTNVVSASLPLAVHPTGRLHVFRPDDGGEEHYAVEVGRPDRTAPVLARLHSACATGDLMGSLKCDCGPQLRAALAQMGEAGAGVLLYLNQEGRGIGLANKMRAYGLQDQGFDTVEANHRLGFADDERDFRIGAEILRKLGFDAVCLMTNNPAKIARMESCGITVTTRVPLQVGRTAENADYLATKAAKSGHLL